jgi:hypothetical protein
MMLKFTEMDRQLAEMMEQLRKLQLMTKKTLLELHFRSNRHLSRKLEYCRLNSRRKTVADIISPTQADADFESNSLVSHSSRTTARKLLTEKLSL